VLAVRRFALRHPALGYKRLTWLMVARGIAYLYPYQVCDILRAVDLLAPRARRNPGLLARPEPPERPDQVWHLDLMYLRIGARWFYLVDILDGYSRYLVHWTLNPTMHAETVTLTVQEALEKLEGQRPAGEPQLVHDHGSQFLSAEWKGFVSAVGSRDIPTRVAHPESNGKLERLHRTHREEGLTEEDLETYHGGLRAMTRWTEYYNDERPHSALKYLPPAVYYRGDPQAELQKREQRLAAGLAARRVYWEGRPP
jgi:transposase InsO family protein